jgi:hypothetical protein
VSRAGLAAFALALLPLAPAAQQRPKAHMEACTEWNAGGAHIATRNDCNRPVTVMFMNYSDRHVVEGDVEPGGWFDSGARAPSAGFMFTVCPVGYIPSVRFSLENRSTIEDSLYNCLPRDRPGV